MEDLESYLEGELASINEMFEQFQTRDQQAEQRIRSETEELRVMEVKAKEVSVHGCVETGSLLLCKCSGVYRRALSRTSSLEGGGFSVRVTVIASVSLYNL